MTENEYKILSNESVRNEFNLDEIKQHKVISRFIQFFGV